MPDEPTSAEGKNLEALSKAIVQHNGNCGDRILRIEMNTYEVERLGWEEFQGIPFVANDDHPNKFFKLVCEATEKDDPANELEESPAIGTVTEVNEDGTVEVELEPAGPRAAFLNSHVAMARACADFVLARTR